MSEIGNAKDIVSLRDLFEEKIKFVDHKIDQTRELFEAWRKADEQALRLQKTENDAHFDHLNGEAGRMKEERNEALRKETFETFQQEYRDWRRLVDLALSSYAGKQTGISGMWTSFFSVIMALAAFSTAAIALFAMMKKGG